MFSASTYRGRDPSILLAGLNGTKRTAGALSGDVKLDNAASINRRLPAQWVSKLFDERSPCVEINVLSNPIAWDCRIVTYHVRQGTSRTLKHSFDGETLRQAARWIFILEGQSTAGRFYYWFSASLCELYVERACIRRAFALWFNSGSFNLGAIMIVNAISMSRLLENDSVYCSLLYHVEWLGLDNKID